MNNLASGNWSQRILHAKNSFPKSKGSERSQKKRSNPEPHSPCPFSNHPVAQTWTPQQRRTCFNLNNNPNHSPHSVTPQTTQHPCKRTLPLSLPQAATTAMPHPPHTLPRQQQRPQQQSRVSTTTCTYRTTLLWYRQEMRCVGCHRTCDTPAVHPRTYQSNVCDAWSHVNSPSDTRRPQICVSSSPLPLLLSMTGNFG